jgi:multidrug efflux pump subunit AcrA (membrane-fusion protein)
MKKAYLLGGIIMAILASLFLSQCSTSSGTEVTTGKAAKGDIVVTVSATGTVRSNNEANLTAVASGRIAKINAKENQNVEKGEIMLELDSAAQFEKDYKRLVALGEKGYVPAQQVELAKEQWKNTFIAAPFSGFVAKKFVEVGEMCLGGSPAFMLVDLNDMIIEANIDETDIGLVKTGQKASVILDAYKDRKLGGTVAFISRTSLEVKEKGITYLVKVKLDPTDLVLRIGMTGDVDVHVSEKKNVLMVPYTAVGEEKNDKFVYVVADKKLKKAVVTTGVENFDNTEILTGIKEGDIIVDSNIAKLKDGMKVTVKDKK